MFQCISNICVLIIHNYNCLNLPHKSQISAAVLQTLLFQSTEPRQGPSANQRGVLFLSQSEGGFCYSARVCLRSRVRRRRLTGGFDQHIMDVINVNTGSSLGNI